MTKLRQWLTENKISQQDFGKQVGVTRGAIWQIANGVITPSLDLAIRIEDATQGGVRARDLLPEQDQSEQKEAVA